MRELSRRGGDYHRATTAVAVKSTVSHPPAVPPPIHSFQTGTAFLLDDTARPFWHKVLAPCPVKAGTQSANSTGNIGRESSWIPQTYLALFLLLCDACR